jgi:hypothetical protein
LGLRTPGVYSIPWKCGQVCIGKTGRSIETRIKEHHRYVQRGHPNKSVVAEHRFNYDHLINLQDSWIHSTKSGYMDWLIREANEFNLHSNNMNRKDSLTFSRPRKLIHLLRGSRQPVSSLNPLYQIWLHGLTYQGSKWVGAPLKQYEQEG